MIHPNFKYQVDHKHIESYSHKNISSTNCWTGTPVFLTYEAMGGANLYDRFDENVYGVMVSKETSGPISSNDIASKFKGLAKLSKNHFSRQNWPMSDELEIPTNFNSSIELPLQLGKVASLEPEAVLVHKSTFDIIELTERETNCNFSEGELVKLNGSVLGVCDNRFNLF